MFHLKPLSKDRRASWVWRERAGLGWIRVKRDVRQVRREVRGSYHSALLNDDASRHDDFFSPMTQKLPRIYHPSVRWVRLSIAQRSTSSRHVHLRNRVLLFENLMWFILRAFARMIAFPNSFSRLRWNKYVFVSCVFWIQHFQ